MIRNIFVSVLLLLLPCYSAGFVLPSGRSNTPTAILTGQAAPGASKVVVVGPLNFFGNGKKDDESVAVAEPPAAEVECVTEEDKNPMNKIKELGVAGVISLTLWEGAFWAIGGGGAVAAYLAANGHLPTGKEEWAVAGGEAFAFANVARLFLPARIALAIATAPWVDDNIVKRFSSKDDD